jgi:hypothetical protein
MRSRFAFLFVLASFALAHPVRAVEQDAKGVEFFEKKIRPVLIEHCYACHSASAEKVKGGLLLDTKAGTLKGGDSGAMFEPNKPEKSLLIKALQYTDDELKMPPKAKLPKQVIADFEQWIAMGAPDPRDTDNTKTRTIDLEAGRKFWSFQLPHLHPVPAVKDVAWVKNDIDRFVLAKLEEKQLQPVKLADRRTLIRRVYFDLIGLPPTPEQVEAFVNDRRPEAFAELIDRLLASPRYGERWARHWLDVARYAEDQAHTFGVKPKTNAYRFRDWVIKAFNDDMPYDRFVRLQIAGDLVPPSEGDLFTRIAGLGFLGLGAEYYKNSQKEQVIAEELDDRVDTLTRGFLGLTVACARCHDHKFDPIPQRDYYSLAGVFNGSTLTDMPLASPDEVKRYNDAQARLKEQDDKVKLWLGEQARDRGRAEIAKLDKYLIEAWRANHLRPSGGKVSTREIAAREGLTREYLDRWVKYLDPANSGKASPLFKEFFAKAEGDAIPEALTKRAADLQREAVAAADEYDKAMQAYDLLLTTLGDKKKQLPKKPELEKSKDQILKAVWLDDKANAPFFLAPADFEKNGLRDEQKKQLTEMRTELDKRKTAMPAMYAVAHVLQGGGQEMKVAIRGNPLKPGEPAPKGFLRVVAPTAAEGKDFTRLDLANTIASKDNPLTARVIVNRVWYHHFGRGLVGTPSNFGLLGERPSHPELLDSLAVRFVEHGWSLKWLHREIVLSATYQLGSDLDKKNAEADAGNVYLWRANRRRIDVEAWRDALLAAAGNLDATMGGPTYDLRDANSKRRTVYAKVSRHELDGLLRMFDFPDANVTAAKRASTTVPQQQLFVLNSEFMVAQAKAFAARVQTAGATDADRIKAAYRLAYGRSPTDAETRLGLAFLAVPTKDRLTPWEQYAQVLLAANEFLYVD